jgi:hypothetical protein
VKTALPRIRQTRPSVFAKDGTVKDAVVVLKSPKLEGDKLTFNIQTLEGDLTGGDGGAALFNCTNRI